MEYFAHHNIQHTVSMNLPVLALYFVILAIGLGIIISRSRHER